MAAPYRACIRSAHFIDGCAFLRLRRFKNCKCVHDKRALIPSATMKFDPDNACRQAQSFIDQKELFLARDALTVV